MRITGLVFICLALLSLSCQLPGSPLLGLELPLVKWVDILSGAVSEFFRMVAGLVANKEMPPAFDVWFAHGVRAALAVAGLWLLVRPKRPVNPLTVKQWKRFKAIRRGYVSLWVLSAFVLLAGLDNLVVGNRALLVSVEGKLRCPFLEKAPIPGGAFRMEPPAAETDYRSLQRRCREENQGNWVLMPLVPYDAKGDTPPVIDILEQREGKYLGHDGRPFTGVAYTAFKDKPDLRRREFRMKDGLYHGDCEGRNRDGTPVEKLVFAHGVEQERKVLVPETDFASLDAQSGTALHHIRPAPTAPSWTQRHFLGTDPGGNDLLAVAFGGFQMIVGTSVYFVLFVYFVGIVVGCVMGYFGGWTDLGGQRLVEIWTAIPFLFVVILVRSVLPNPTPMMVVTLLAVFGWMGIAAYMRTAAFREKARDYVAGARLQGAGTGRLIFKHILPNSLAIITTLIPFTIDHLIFSLTALDFLAFGLPAGSPSWGNILREGTNNLNAPWIVLTGFFALVVVLLLVTFIGEAIREAFDPKKFTTYR